MTLIMLLYKISITQNFVIYNRLRGFVIHIYYTTFCVKFQLKKIGYGVRIFVTIMLPRVMV